jgi:hypothetical protein
VNVSALRLRDWRPAAWVLLGGIVGFLVASAVGDRFDAKSEPALRSVSVTPFTTPVFDDDLVTRTAILTEAFTRELASRMRESDVSFAPSKPANDGRPGDRSRFVLEGDVRPIDGDAVITIRLRDARESKPIEGISVRIPSTNVGRIPGLEAGLAAGAQRMVSRAIVRDLAASDESTLDARDLIDLAANVPNSSDALLAVRERRRLADAALERDPGYAPAWTLRARTANAMLHLDYASDAKALFAASDADSLRAVRADPASVDAWLVRADSLRQQGEATAASAALDRAEDAQPTATTRHRVSIARAWLSIAEGKPQDALARLAPLRPAPLRPVLESPGDDALLPRCAAYLLLGHYGAAIDNCEGVGSLDDWAVNLYLAAAYALDGRIDKARLASGWLLGSVPAFTLERYRSRFHARMAADGAALERAHLLAGLRRAGVPEK